MSYKSPDCRVATCSDHKYNETIVPNPKKRPEFWIVIQNSGRFFGLGTISTDDTRVYPNLQTSKNDKLNRAVHQSHGSGRVEDGAGYRLKRFGGYSAVWSHERIRVFAVHFGMGKGLRNRKIVEQ